MHKIIFSALVAASLSRAFQFPFDISGLLSNLEPPFDTSSLWSKLKPPLSPIVVPLRSPRIAIIGAGAGGSSAAFWISKAKERHGLDIGIDIYERNDYIGGRSITVYPHNNTEYEPVELGASIFVDANKNLLRAANEFNLSFYGFDDEDGDMAIWDGERISHRVVESESSFSWLPSWLQNFGFLKSNDDSSPRRMQALIRAMTDKMVSLYEPSMPNWSSVDELINALNWTDLVSQTGAQYFQSHNLSEKFTNEIIGAQTRIHYAQNIDSIHGLGAIISITASSGGGIRGGNWQIFEQFVKRSGAHALFKAEVVGIERYSNHSWIIVTEEGRRDYDAVIIAAPYHSSHIALPADLSTLIPPQPYVHLHTTLLTTTAATLNPVYFGYKPGSKVATNVVTTFDGVGHDGRASEFNFISYQGQAKFAKNETHDGQETGEWVVKISSTERISDEWLATMFQNQVGWVQRKEWDAYPVLSPTTKFPPIRLDDGLFYVNAIEPFISSMEAETLASRNIVDLLMQERFNASICPLEEGKEGGAEHVHGWDC